MPKINWNAVEEQDFTPVPEGKYEAIIDGVEIKETQKGDEMWLVHFKLLNENYKNRQVLTNLVFNEGGYGNIKKLYSAIFGTKLPKNCETSDIDGEKVLIDVIITEYNGKKYNNIPYAGFYASNEEDEEAPF